MNNILIIYNFAQKYRTAIFKKIEHSWECRWIFGKNTSDIVNMDTTCLKNVRFVENHKTLGPFIIQDGIVKEASKTEYDILLMLGEPYNLSTWSIMLRNRFRKKRKKIYLWSHGWYGREGYIKKWMKRIYFGLADATFLYGNYAKTVAISQGFPPHKLDVIHNSLDHDNQVKLRTSLSPSDIYFKHFGNTNPVLIFIGRLTEVKRLDLLINAVSLLRCQNLYCNILLIGDGEKRNELEILVRNKGLERNVWFFGACYDDRLNAQLIYNADLCVAPGNVGLTAMHTMVFGTPVLTHDNYTMQMPEFEAIIPGKTGSFFRYNDVYSLAKEISNWLASYKDKRDEVRKACFDEIDTRWTPEFQIDVLNNYL